jgi:predicted ester cyclase
MKAFINRVRTGMPDSKFTVERQIAEGNKVASRWYMEGTHTGLFMGVEATGNTVKDQGVDIFVIAGGKIVEVWVNEDGLGLLRQVGAFK